jgi:AcrR family transcriptional regulator
MSPAAPTSKTGGSTARRPAHRPSRRAHIVEAALRLFARVPFDDVTVGDIADAAEMTPAAVYYHFAGKEQILLEGMQVFSAELIARVRRAVDEQLPVRETMSATLEHVAKRRTSATVYFINSAGLNIALESHRKAVRVELAELLADASRRARGRLPIAEAGVMGAALVSLLEVSAAAMIARDATFRGIGARGFVAAVGDLADNIIGIAP